MRHRTLKTAELVLLLLADDGVRARHGASGPIRFPDDLVPDLERAQLGCPLCGRTNTLYENVTVMAWMTVNGHRLEDDGETVRPTIRHGPSDQEADFDSAEHEGYACSSCCRDGENLTELALVVAAKTGWDGKVIRRPMPGQLEIEERQADG